MKSKATLEYADIQSVMSAATACAIQNDWAVSIAITDDGGHLLALNRLDGAAPISAYIAAEKARTSAMGRRESGGYEKVVNEGRTAFLSAPVLKGMLEGGTPILFEGQVIGAIGVSGVKSSEDLQIAKAGLAAIGEPNA